MGNGGWKFVMMSSAREVQAGATADGVGAFELLELEAFVEVPGVGGIVERMVVKLGTCQFSPTLSPASWLVPSHQ